MLSAQTGEKVTAAQLLGEEEADDQKAKAREAKAAMKKIERKIKKMGDAWRKPGVVDAKPFLG